MVGYDHMSRNEQTGAALSREPLLGFAATRTSLEGFGHDWGVADALDHHGDFNPKRNQARREAGGESSSYQRQNDTQTAIEASHKRPPIAIDEPRPRQR